VTLSWTATPRLLSRKRHTLQPPRGIRLAVKAMHTRRGIRRRHFGIPNEEEIAMANMLDNCKVAILAVDGFEEVELTEPRRALKEAGAQVDVISQKSGEIQGFRHIDKGSKWLPVSAGIVKGHTMTSWPSLQDDIRNAGGKWVDKDMVHDGNLITSRKPDDLPAFNAELLSTLSAAAGTA
jgi:protease I